MKKDTKNRLGTFVSSENYKAFLPPLLPPELNLTSLQTLLSEANRALGRLDIVSDILPNQNLLLYFYMRKEAVLSSQIEGTQSSLSDLLLYENKATLSVPNDDVEEVSSYIMALEYGLKRIKEGFPLSLRLIREMHSILLSKGRGANKQPGEFRKIQNWIGGSQPSNARFVPPPANHLTKLLDDFERYLHLEKKPYVSLIDAGLILAQFETIHPFLDGNGRIGRLLIIFFLIITKDIREPNLYLSLFFKNNRHDYYNRLNAVRTKGDWEGWIEFFLRGIIETANQFVVVSQDISNLFKNDLDKTIAFKRASTSASKTYKLLQEKGIVSVIDVAEKLNVSKVTARTALNKLKDLKIVTNTSSSGRTQFYQYTNFLKLLEKGTEPINYNA